MANEPVAQPEQDLVFLYLNDIGKYELLTKDDEVRLAQAVEAGRMAQLELVGARRASAARTRELRHLIRLGDEATETFVKANLRLVVSIAKRYRATEEPLLDLIQDGNLGLMHAVEKFDWRKGFKFSTYATWWIRQAISRGIVNSARSVRLPVDASALLTRVINASGRLEGQLGRYPSAAEIAADLEIEVDKVTEILRHAAEPLSLSQPLREGHGTELGDVVADRSVASQFDTAEAKLLTGEIRKLLIVLDDREREILRQRFGLDRDEPHTLVEVAAHFKLSRERIRQIEARAMCKLRHPSMPLLPRELVTD
jgi:RNA polymerase sigma factor (sigma-70 family)